MNNFEINSLLIQHPSTRPIYLGCFTINVFLKRKFFSKEWKDGPKTGITILNLCEEVGCHWVALAVTKSYVIYFDPSGVNSLLIVPPLAKFLTALCKRKNLPLIINRTPIQSNSSKYCGPFSMLFLLCLAKNHTIDEYLKIFDKKRLTNNDLIAKKLMKKMFNYNFNYK